MSNSTIKLKSSTTAGNTPSSLETGEFAINVEDGNLFYGSASAVKQDLVLETLTVKGSLTAENYIVSSSVTHMTQSFSSGSTIFGDSIDDTHLFTGSLSITGSSHIIKGTSTKINQGTKTAIDISSTSGNNIVKLGDALASDNETYIEINDNTQTITTTAQSLDLRGVQVTPNITASGNISSSGYISASAFIGDGSGLTGLSSAAITSYTNASNGRLITTVDSTSVEGQQFLRYTNQGGLIINNAASGPIDTGITVHGNIFGSGSHIRLRSRDTTGSSGFYLSSSGDFLATTFKLHFGDIENQGNNTTLIVDDANEQITTSKTLGVTGNITVTGTVDGRDVAADGTKLDGLTAAGISGSFTAASASFSTRVTANDAKLTANTSNVTSAGALMDSEVTNLAQVKAFDSSNYATAAQGTKADTAIQPSQTSSFSTATGVEDNADVTDTANVTSAGALMDSELTEIATVKALTKAGISGSFNAASASFSTRVTANDAKLTANTSNVTSAGALMDSEVTNLAQVKAFDSSDYATAAQGTKADTAIQPSQTGSFLIAADTGSLITAAQTSSFSTATGVEDNADVTDTANVTSAGALMDSELAEIATVKSLTAAGISGSFNAASASFSTRVTANDAKLTANTSNVTSAGALMDSELAEIATVKALTAAGISGSFTAASASLASDIPTNNNQLTNGAGYTTNTGTVTSVATGNGLTGGTITSTGTLSVDYAGTGNIITNANANQTGYSAADDFIIRYNENDEEVQKTSISNFISGYSLATGDNFDADGTFASLRAQGTTAGDVGLGNVTNESKATMFTSPTFTGTVAIPGFADVSSSLASAVAGGDNLGNHTATTNLNLGGNDITNVGNVDGVDVSTLKSDFDTLENTSKGRITYLYTSSTSTSYVPPAGYIAYIDSVVDYVLVNTSSYNNVDLVGGSGGYGGFLYTELGSLITTRNTSNGAFQTHKVIDIITGHNDDSAVRFGIQSIALGISSGSLSNGDEVEFIWDKSAGVGGAYSATAGAVTKTLAGIYQPGYNYLDMFFGVGPADFDGSPDNLSGVNPSGSHENSHYYLPAISQSDSLTLGGLTINGDITVTGNVDGIDVSTLTAANISGAFDSVSASLAADIPTNNNQLTNGAGYTTNTGTVTSVATGNGLTGGTITSTGTLSVDYAGTGNIITNANANQTGYSAADDFIIRYNENDEEVQKTSISNFISGYSLATGDNFDADGTFASLRAQGTTAGDVGLGNVTNESKATMFTSPTFTGTVAIPGFADVSASLAASTPTKPRFAVNGAAFLSQIAERALPFGSTTGESTSFTYTTTYMIPADCKLLRVNTCSQSNGGDVILKAYKIPDTTADNTAISNGTLLQTVTVQDHDAGDPFEFTFGSTGTITKGSKFGLTVTSDTNPNGFRFTAYFEEV